MKYLPTEMSYLKALISLKVANNKLLELPPALSSLQRLENLDLSNNRLSSLGSLDLGSMHNLKNLNLQVLMDSSDLYQSFTEFVEGLFPLYSLLYLRLTG